MYAKLVTSGSAVPAFIAMRDICRLLTSANPSVSLLSGFSQTNSVIIDATPAGWTYVGSNSPLDGSGIAAGSDLTGFTTDVQYNLALSAPCAESSSLLKYAVFTLGWLGAASNTTNISFNLTAAQSVTAGGVCTNEGPRYFVPAASASTLTANSALRSGATDVLHVIANQRHITIIVEARGFSAVWETSMTDVHRFYNAAPVLQFSHNVTSILLRNAVLVPTSRTTTNSQSMICAGIAMTNVATGAFNGTVDSSNGDTMNDDNNLFQYEAATRRVNTISATGAQRYQLNPVWVHHGWLGYPVQYITGVVPIYWTKPQIGSTGDEMIIGGESYTFFNAGSGVGMVMQTS